MFRFGPHKPGHIQSINLFIYSTLLLISESLFSISPLSLTVVIINMSYGLLSNPSGPRAEPDENSIYRGTNPMKGVLVLHGSFLLRV